MKYNARQIKQMHFFLFSYTLSFHACFLSKSEQQIHKYNKLVRTSGPFITQWTNFQIQKTSLNSQDNFNQVPLPTVSPYVDRYVGTTEPTGGFPPNFYLNCVFLSIDPKKFWNFWASPVGSILSACHFSERSGFLPFWMKGLLACYFEGQIGTEFDQTRMNE